MLGVWGKPSLHTQNTTGNQPKLRKQAFPKPQVWCAILGLHTHTENKKMSKRYQILLKKKKMNRKDSNIPIHHYKQNI
jgi:hypothetical protein